MLISAFLIVVKALALVAALGFAGRAALRAVFREQPAEAIDAWSAIAAGVVLLYACLVVARRVPWALAAISVFAALGIWQACREQRAPHPAAARLAGWEIALLVLLATVMLAEPLYDWDARSIWFYHAKIIFYHGLDAETWRYVARETGFSHPYYPKLVPAVAGASAWLFGFWNDYLPKLGLAIVVLPGLALGSRLFADWRGRALFWILTIATLRKLGLGNNLWLGNMDGPLAVWSAVALLYVVAGLLGVVSAARATAVSALALAICAGLKVEGWVIAAAFFAGLAMVYALHRPSGQPALRIYAKAAAVVAIPYLLWRLYCYQAGVGEGWATLSGDYFSLAAARLSDRHSASGIAREMFTDTILVTIGLLAAALVLLRNAGAAWRRAAAAGVLILALYWAALFFAYLGTPHDLEAQLRTSVTRTVLAPRLWVLALLLAGYMVWRGAWRGAGHGEAAQ